MTAKPFAALFLAVGIAISFAACGDETDGIPCDDSADCPEVDCGQGVHTRVCIDHVCVTDVENACELGASTVASGETVGAGVGGTGGASGG